MRFSSVLSVLWAIVLVLAACSGSVGDKACYDLEINGVATGDTITVTQTNAAGTTGSWERKNSSGTVTDQGTVTGGSGSPKTGTATSSTTSEQWQITEDEDDPDNEIWNSTSNNEVWKLTKKDC